MARLEFPRETGLILRCAGKAGNPFQTTQGNRLSCHDQEGRRGSDEAVPGQSVFPSREPGVSGNFWGSQEGCQGPFRPRDPCLPWRGILGPGHTPRCGLFSPAVTRAQPPAFPRNSRGRLRRLTVGMQCACSLCPGRWSRTAVSTLFCRRSCILSRGSSYWSHIHVQLEDGRRTHRRDPFPTLPGHSLEVM